MGLWCGWGPRDQRWYAENHISNLDCITWKDRWRSGLGWAFKNYLNGRLWNWPSWIPGFCCLQAVLSVVHFIHLSVRVSVTNSVFPSFSALWTNCPGNAHSWPCLHQVRQVSFYFVFHQLLLLNKALGSLEYPPLFKCASFSPGQLQCANATSCATPCNLLFQQKENLDSVPLASHFRVS